MNRNQPISSDLTAQARSQLSALKASAGQPAVAGEYVKVKGDWFYRIANNHRLPEFFMSLASSSDHWMFISSQGALSAGRKDPDDAIFPYYCADKLQDFGHCTGPRTIVRLADKVGAVHLWEPFTKLDPRRPVVRNLFKNEIGNRLIFEEVEPTLGLVFRYEWTFGHQFGFIRKAEIENLHDSEIKVTILDGLENIMPSGFDHNFQMRYSNLGDAYKKTELVQDSGLGIFYLSSIPTDRAEPNEGLRANVVWQSGMQDATILLSSRQLNTFRHGGDVTAEADIRGHRGAYFGCREVNLQPGAMQSWMIVANTDHDAGSIVRLSEQILEQDIDAHVRKDIADCENRLKLILANSDACQLGANRLRINRHRSSVLYNVMRGGIPANGYIVDGQDFCQHVKHFNSAVYDRNKETLAGLRSPICVADLVTELRKLNEPDLLRIGLEYMPLTFGRRHGDPTRPWNLFSIASLNDDGTREIDYQGNWRDIFQNWESLSLAFPRLAERMVFRFLNSSTADGYNPYRVTKNGFEWECPDPNDPWSNIGYWGDHQIVYLLKLLERTRNFGHCDLNQWLDEEGCTYAQVPYRIRAYDEILKDPYETIDFDYELQAQIEKRVESLGADGKLLQNREGEICRVTMGEKLLVPLLVKLTNFVPDGGIWLNTQRPEWNDANNALVGYGLSMVTVCYLRRYCKFLTDWFKSIPIESFRVSQEVIGLFSKINSILLQHLDAVDQQFSASDRKTIVDQLSVAGSEYRNSLYTLRLSGGKDRLEVKSCVELFETAIKYLDATIGNNLRGEDGLYNSYNLLRFERADGEQTGIEIEELYPMLEGQVAVLSSGKLGPVEVVSVLDSLRASKMYREDQCSYLLYPDRELPTFLEKNLIPVAQAENSKLIQELVAANDETIVFVDVKGNCRFNGDFNNSARVELALAELQSDPRFEDVRERKQEILDIYESVFQHHKFTGRSGTFFGYEGLGSIYWHMVSKLVVAVQENFIWAQESGADHGILTLLARHYREIRDGIALDKTPEQYGAFPTDPYSHTPSHAGAQQPGMTGQVKEDIIARLGEIGVRIRDGILSFEPSLFESSEFTTAPATFDYFDVAGEPQSLEVETGCFAFTICQIPVIYHRSKSTKLRLNTVAGIEERNFASNLSADETQRIFARDGSISTIEFFFPANE